MIDSKKSKQVGNSGEDLAWEEYQKRGYTLLERHYIVYGVGEADLILAKGDQLIIAEVKTRRTLRYGEPLESISKLKQHRLKEVARQYLSETEYNSVRFDCVSIKIGNHSITVDITEEAFI